MLSYFLSIHHHNKCILIFSLFYVYFCPPFHVLIFTFRVVLTLNTRHGKLRSSRARRTDSYKSSSRNSDVTSSEQPGPARGQRSDTSAEVTIETGYMLANELSSSPCDAQYSYVTNSLQHSYTNQKDLGRSDTGHVLLTPSHEESAEMYSLTYTYVDVVDKDTKDSRGLRQPSTATYTNSRMLASSGGIGCQDPDLSLQGDTAESPREYLYARVCK